MTARPSPSADPPSDDVLAEMRRIAEAATPGVWQVSGVRQKFPIAGQAHAVGPDGDAVALVFYDPKCHAQHWADARYIAAVHPQAVLAVLDALAAAREAIQVPNSMDVLSALTDHLKKRGSIDWNNVDNAADFIATALRAHLLPQARAAEEGRDG